MQAAITTRPKRARAQLWLTTHDRRRHIGGWQAMRRLHGDGAGRWRAVVLGRRRRRAVAPAPCCVGFGLMKCPVRSPRITQKEFRGERMTSHYFITFFFIASNKVMVVISIGPYKTQSPKRIDSAGQRARFKVKPQRAGHIVQSIRAYAFLDESMEEFNYTEAWRIQSNKKIEQQGDDSFLIPRSWIRDYSGRFYITAQAWYQTSLGNDFARGVGTDHWGLLMGVPYVKIPPDGTPVLERFWMANGETVGGRTHVRSYSVKKKMN